MTALSGPKKGTSKSRQLKTFQVDLAYPEASSSSGSGSGRAAAGSGGSAAAAASSPSIGCSPVKAGSGGMMRAESPAPGEEWWRLVCVVCCVCCVVVRGRRGERVLFGVCLLWPWLGLSLVLRLY